MQHLFFFRIRIAIANPFISRRNFEMRHSGSNARVVKRYGIWISYCAELQYRECRKVTRRLFLVGSQSSARIQFHGAAGNLLCRTQLGELRFATGASWSNFAEKISEELIIRLSTLNCAFPMFLLLGIRTATVAAIYFSCATSANNCS